MRTLSLIALVVTTVAVASPAQILRVDSVSVDSVWDGAGASTSRDCKVSFVPRGEGLVRIFVNVSVDSAKTWSFPKDSFTRLDTDGYFEAFEAGKKASIVVRILGADRKGVAISLTGHQDAPAIYSNPAPAHGLAAVLTPGQNAIVTIRTSLDCYLWKDSFQLGYCTLAKVYWDFYGDGTVDDSTTGAYVNDRIWHTTVPPVGQTRKTIIRALDKNGLWSSPDTLTVEFGLLMDGVYRSVASQYSSDGANWFNHWMIGDIVSDDAEKGGESPADISDLYVLRNFTAGEGNSIVAPQWQMPYEAIFLANRVVDSMPAVTMDAALKARTIAEAKFLRAWSYFILVRTFGDVPLAPHALFAADICQTRTPKAQVWSYIETDLTQAASALPEKSDYDVDDMWRASKGAANALLVKTYIYEKKFPEAEALAVQIISSLQYTLMANYADNFRLAQENGPESVFEIQYFVDPKDSWSNENGGQVFSVFRGSRDDAYFPGWGFDCPTQSLANEFEPGDVRKKTTILAAGDTLYKGTSAEQVYYPGSSPTGMSAGKYMLEYLGDSVPDMANAPANWRAIRYSEVLLFAAEASNENGNTAQALVNLNRVRARAGLAACTVTGKDSLRSAIYHERRVELALEGHRFWDVVRQGRGSQVFGSMGFVYGKNEIFAVPKTEIESCTRLTQNPGY
jgi:starch-binding outer membrane protein, SusD/RagB family